MARRRGAVVILLTLAAGLLAGCGKDEKRLTEAQFIAQGNRICQASADRINAAAEAAFPEGSGTPSDDAVVAFAKDQALPELVTKFKQLSALKAPKELKDRFEIGVAKGLAILEEVRKDPSELATSTGLFGESNRELGEAGLTVCAQ